MPISHEHKLVFIHVPKCAGTTVETLLKVGSIDDLYSPKSIKNTSLYIDDSRVSHSEFLIIGNKTPQHLTYTELMKLLPDSISTTFNFFTVVRNPYSRMVSEFNFLRCAHSSPTSPIHAVTASFKRLLSCLSAERIERIKRFDGHLETQSSYLIDAEGKISNRIKIHRFEELPRCLDWLLALTNNNQIPHDRKSIDNTPYQEYYDSDSQAMVYNFYKEDFTNFNYSKML